MKLLDIGVLSERSGVPPSTLRYYEEIGLIEFAGTARAAAPIRGRDTDPACVDITWQDGRVQP